MKKSSAILLTFLTGTTLSVTACTEEAKPVRNVAECIAAGQTKDQCETQQKAALEEYQKTAPKFKTQQECIAEWGANNCQQQTSSNGNSWFMPAMMGWIIGNQMGRNSNPAPVYRSYNGSMTSKSSAGSRSGIMATKASSISRGGFGHSAHSSIGA